MNENISSNQQYSYKVIFSQKEIQSYLLFRSTKLHHIHIFFVMHTQLFKYFEYVVANSFV